MICIFAVILIFRLPSDYVVEKMSVSHANENEIYNLYFILLKILIIDSYTPPTVQPSIQSIKITTLQHASGNKKRCSEVSVSHKMFAHMFLKCSFFNIVRN